MYSRLALVGVPRGLVIMLSRRMEVMMTRLYCSSSDNRTMVSVRASSTTLSA